MKKYLLFVMILSIAIASCQSPKNETDTDSASNSAQSGPTDTPIPPTPTAEPFISSLIVIGPPEIVYKWDTDRCNDDMLPDLPVRAIRDADGMIQLTIPSTTNYRLIGPDFDSLKPDCTPIMLSDRDRDPSHYNHSEWVASTYTDDGMSIYAIIHNEFHGDQAGSTWQANLDFSDQQGSNNWTYQSWDGSTYTDMKYKASTGDWVGTRSLCIISWWGMSPDIGCDPSLTWTSPMDGKVSINGRVYDGNIGGGNGVDVSILNGDEEIWTAGIDEGDNTGQKYDIELDVHVGDQIHFRSNARGDAGWDATAFTPGINKGPAPCPSGFHGLCTLISLTSAISTDGGKTYTQAPAPNHRVASFPYQYDPDWMRGLWQPSGIVKNPNDGYYYVLVQYDEHSADSSKNLQGMCVMRTQTLDDPTSWRAWDGSGFNMDFINPYLETDANPEEHNCTLVTPENNALSYGLTYNTYLEKFVATGASGSDRPGFYYAVSDDLVHWTPKQFFMDATMGFLNGNQPPYDAYPTLIDHQSSSRSFDTTGQTAYLYYSIVTNNSPWSDDLVRVPVAFTKGTDPVPTLPMVEGAAPTENISKEPVEISILQKSRIVPLDTPVIMTFGWGAATEELTNDFISSAQFEVTLDGTAQTDAANPWREIESSGNGQFQSRWSYPLGILEPGQHTVKVKITLANPVSDGLGNDYNGQILETTMQISVEP